MNRIRKTVFVFILTLSASGVHAQTEVRLSGLMSWEWDEKKSRLQEIRKDELSLGGFEFEITGDYLGFGMDGLADFEQDAEDSWFLNWQGQFFIRYHLFGNDGLLDPYIEGAYGNSGITGLDGSARPAGLSLYSSAGAGLNLLLQDGFFMGARMNYRLEESAIPAADMGSIDMTNWQGAVFAGVRLGCEKSHRRRYYDRYFDEY